MGNKITCKYCGHEEEVHLQDKPSKPISREKALKIGIAGCKKRKLVCDMYIPPENTQSLKIPCICEDKTDSGVFQKKFCNGFCHFEKNGFSFEKNSVKN